MLGFYALCELTHGATLLEYAKQNMHTYYLNTYTFMSRFALLDSHAPFRKDEKNGGGNPGSFRSRTFEDVEC